MKITSRLKSTLLALNLVGLLALNFLTFANYSRVNAQMSLIQFRRTVTAKAADYTLAPATDTGIVFTSTGASATITFTLPTVTAAMTGADFYIFNTVDQTLTVSAQTAGQIIFKNDLAANSVSYGTSSEKIGGGFHITCDGTSYLVMPLAEELQTITVVT